MVKITGRFSPIIDGKAAKKRCPALGRRGRIPYVSIPTLWARTVARTALAPQTASARS